MTDAIIEIVSIVSIIVSADMIIESHFLPHCPMHPVALPSSSEGATSGVGQSRRSDRAPITHFRSAPINGHAQRPSVCLKGARLGSVGGSSLLCPNERASSARPVNCEKCPEAVIPVSSLKRCRRAAG